ncbi:MAG: hypothetical protein LC803_16725 [Acidobacteria bacterium]|nr:hypothetical protein [Acidobacteriota bacterium]
MKRTFRNFAATLVLLFSPFGYCSYSASAQSCVGNISVSGRVTDYYGNGVSYMSVKFTSGNTKGGVQTDVNGYYSLQIPKCVQTYVAPDSNHSSNTYGYEAEASPNYVLVSSSTTSNVTGANFSIPSCTSGNQIYLSGNVSDYNNGNGLKGISGIWVVAHDPRTDEVLSYTYVTDTAGYWYMAGDGNGGANLIGGCSYYKVLPYIAFTGTNWVDPPYLITNTGGMNVNGYYSGYPYPYSLIRPYYSLNSVHHAQ